LRNHATLQRSLATQPCNASLQRNLATQPCNATLQRNLATQPCNATLQRNLATQPCNATLQRNYHATLQHNNHATLNFFAVGLAAAIPKLDLFISLVGAVSSSTLALMAPSIIDTVVHWPNMGPGKINLARNIFLFVIGFIGFATGSFVSMQGIIQYFKSSA
jgi:hypothetical protein